MGKCNIYKYEVTDMSKILIVEADLTINALLSDYLTDAGHIIFSAYDS